MLYLRYMLYIGSRDTRKSAKVVTLEAEATIKAASAKNIREFFNKNKDVDLIAKDIQSHDECYKTFTRGFSIVFREEKLAVHDEQATQMVSQEL